jgi:hypothetical protein
MPARQAGPPADIRRTEKFQSDPRWGDNISFYEYFRGDNGAGIGASHQTGGTGVVALFDRSVRTPGSGSYSHPSKGRRFRVRGAQGCAAGMILLALGQITFMNFHGLAAQHWLDLVVPGRPAVRS